MSGFCKDRSYQQRSFGRSPHLIFSLTSILLLSLLSLASAGARLALAGPRVTATVGPQLEVCVGPGGQAIGKAETTVSRAAYDPNHNRFLVVWYDWRDFPDNGTWGRLFNGDGTPYGDAFSICTSDISQHCNPGVVFDSVNQRFLVVWADNRFGIWGFPAWGAMGQFVGPDGSLQGTEFVISPNDGGYPAFTAYSSVDQRFLVLFIQGAGTPQNLQGQYVKADGSLSGQPFPITDIQTGYGVWRCTAAYDSNNNGFLVAYGNETTGQTCARLVNGSGSVGGEIVLNSVKKQLNTATFDPLNRRFLVLWERAFNDSSSDIFDQGHLFNADGTPYGSKITILPGISSKIYGGGFDATFDPSHRQFLVVGTSGTVAAVFGQIAIFGQVLNLNGTLCGSPFAILDPGNMVPIWPYVVCGSPSAGAMVVYQESNLDDLDIVSNMVRYTVNNPGISPLLNLLLD